MEQESTSHFQAGDVPCEQEVLTGRHSEGVGAGGDGEEGGGAKAKARWIK